MANPGLSRFRRGSGALGLGLAVLVGVLATPGMADAQDTASIIGQVTDESGAILPGVTVTATSPALQVQQVTALTDERGEYRLTPLPIGIYSVTYELSGFQGVRREGLRLTVGFVAKVDLVLKVGSLEETVTVTGASPVVDVSSTSTRTQLTRETIELTPTGRSGYLGLLSQAPSVISTFDIGGSSGGNAHTTVRAFGQSAEGWNIIDGVVSTAPQGDGGNGAPPNHDSFEEANIQTFGTDAEAATRGVQLTTVVKSGSNQFHGSGYYSVTGDKLQADNIDANLQAQGIRAANNVSSRWDLSGDAGGRIVRDKLWFYGGLRRRSSFSPGLDAFNLDGTQAEAFDGQKYATAKISYQLKPGHRILAFTGWAHNFQYGTPSRTVSGESVSSVDTAGDSSKVEWQAIFGNSLVASLLVGRWRYDTWVSKYDQDDPETTKILANMGRRTDKPAASDISALVQVKTFGQALTSEQWPENDRNQVTGSVSLYRPDLFFGNHELKSGVTFHQSFHAREQRRRRGGNYQLIFNNGVPFEINAFNFPTQPGVKSNYLAAFVKDSWTMGRRLTLDIGVRYVHDNGFVPAVCRDAADPPGNVIFPAGCFDKVQFKIWNTMQPRLHFAYDVGSDAKMVVKGGWGRFYHIYTLDPDLTASDRLVAQSALYLWHDLNGNKDYDAGEVNLDPNGPDYLSTNSFGTTNVGGTRGVPNPDEKSPRTDEYSLSVQRQLMAHTAVRVTGIYSRGVDIRRQTNLLRPPSEYNVQITRSDPGRDGRVGTADDPGRSLTYFEYPASLAGQAFERFMWINDPKADQNFKSIELAAYRQFASNWQFSVAFSGTKKHIPFGGIPGTFANTTVNVDNPNAEFNTTDDTWEKNAKVSGSYLIPWRLDLRVSTNYQAIFGVPQARTVVLTGGRTIPSITVNAEPIGSASLPTIHLVDLRIERAFSLGPGRQVIARLTSFNVLNRNTPTAMNWASGVTFGQVTRIMPPRIIDLGVSYTF